MENGQSIGVVVDKLKAGMIANNASVSFSDYPHGRCVESVRMGKVDFALFVDQQDRLAMLDEPLADWDLAVVSHTKIDAEQDFQAEQFNKVIIARDYEYPPELMRKLKTFNKSLIRKSYFFTKDEEITALFELLKRGRADALVVDQVWANYMKNKLNLDIHVSDWTLYSEPQYVGYNESLDSKKLSLMNQILLAN
ncbi:MAG: hypothetical protein HWE10_11365 [Gammaproteobacteria bacterium]|nr:hypothetical protein [Gammaproteobacteria bacterium]